MENNETTETIVENSEAVGEVTQEPIKNEEKTFTQADFNSFEKKIKEKYAKKYEGIDLEGYKAWVESQKSLEEKQAEKEKEYESVRKELDTLKQTNAILEKGVDRKWAKFIAFEVSQLDGDFNENLDKYLSEHEEYTNKEPVATGQAVQSIETTQNDGVLSYLQQMHPELNFKK